MTPISDDMVERGVNALRRFGYVAKDRPMDLTHDEAESLVMAVVGAALEGSVAVPADRAAIIEECAQAAEGPLYMEFYRGKEGHNWWHEKQGGNDAQYGNGRHAAAAAIRALPRQERGGSHE